MTEIVGTGEFGMNLGDLRKFVAAHSKFEDSTWIDATIETQGELELAKLVCLSIDPA
jgi:hypothetical protein